jgi:hypothetical protein
MGSPPAARIPSTRNEPAAVASESATKRAGSIRAVPTAASPKAVQAIAARISSGRH